MGPKIIIKSSYGKYNFNFLFVHHFMAIYYVLIAFMLQLYKSNEYLLAIRFCLSSFN